MNDVECKPFEQAARLSDARIEFLRDYWRGRAILNANMAAEFRTHEDHYSATAALYIDTAAALYQLQSDLEKARAETKAEIKHRESMAEMWARDIAQLESERDSLRASLAAMEGENKRLRAELVSPASGETWERLARGHEIVASQRGEEIEQLHGQLRRARKAAARGWSAWLENVLAEIDEARASENDEYADELVEVLRPLQAALSGETHGK